MGNTNEQGIQGREPQIPCPGKLFHQPFPGQAHDCLKIVAALSDNEVGARDDQRNVVPVFAEIDFRFYEDAPGLAILVLICIFRFHDFLLGCCFGVLLFEHPFRKS